MEIHLVLTAYHPDMFYEQRLSVPDAPDALRAEYDAELRAVVDDVGAATAASETEVDRALLDALLDGESPPLSLEDAATIQALGADQPDAETIVVEACEHLLLGMSTAVLDVEALASQPTVELEPKEIQQKIERRAPMSFDEFVTLQYAIADQAP